MRHLLQQGWGMMALNNEMLESGIGSGVILSPRVSTPEQVSRHAQDIRDRGGTVLFDPQFYIPRTSLARILEFPYWQGLTFDTETFDAEQSADFCRRVVDYQTQVLGVNEIILPGMYTNTADDRWKRWQASFADAGVERSKGRICYSTMAIGPDVVKNRDAFDAAIDEAINYPTAGIYVLLRPPADAFLITDEDYLYAILDAFLSLREAQKEVIVGYANQQALLFAAVGVTSIASGNFRNVRSFNPEIFDVQEEADRQRAIWYYDASTLSEFRVQTIQLAYRRGLRDQFGPTCRYCAALIESDNPSMVSWTEPDAFRHFLLEMSRQWLEPAALPANARLPFVRDIFLAALGRLRSLLERGVLPGDRSFVSAFEPSLAALEAIRFDRAMSLSSL